MALFGFAPSTRKGPIGTVAQLDVEISAGTVNGIQVGAQFVTCNPLATNYVSVNNLGVVSVLTVLGQVVNLIATVVAGLVVTS